MGTWGGDVRVRCGKASDVFEKMRPVWSSKKIRLGTKIRLYKAIVVPTALYASETWRKPKAIARKVDAFQQRCLRRILGITYRDRVKNEEIMRRTGQRRLQDVVAGRRSQFWGHVVRMDANRIPRSALGWFSAEGKRKKGRPRQTWRRTIEKDLREAGTTMQEATETATNRPEWRKLVARCVQGHGRI